tara:strand:+ start:87 stop:788 length:702 start_codon:yes stop_codon:yes gene_type:complete
MRLRLSKFTKKKLPFKEDEIPLKTKEKIEEHLQSAISFLQTQQNVLNRTLDVLESMADLAEVGEEKLLPKKKQEEENEKTEERLRELVIELKWLATLEFNKQLLFSGENKEKSFKLFKGAGPKAPTIKQHPVKHHVEALTSEKSVDATSVRKMLNALNEMLGQTDAAVSDLQTSFTALTSDPEANKELNFIEEKVETWVSEILARTDGISVQAHISPRQVDGLVREQQGKFEK